MWRNPSEHPEVRGGLTTPNEGQVVHVHILVQVPGSALFILLTKKCELRIARTGIVYNLLDRASRN